MASITISGLNTDSQVQSGDFIPIVNSASLTTYKTTVQAIGNYIAASGSVISASYALTASYAKTATAVVSSSWASQSLYSVSSSFASQSLSSSAAISSSWATTTLNAISTSFAAKSNTSISSSWASSSINSISASYAPFQASNSSSWASSSLSASYAKSASIAANLVPNTLYPVTASWALNTVTNQSTITFLSAPVPIASGTSAIGLTKYNGSLIPSYATGVILEAWAQSANTNAQGFIYVADNAAGNGKKILIGFMSAGGGDWSNFAGQGFYPVSSSASGGKFWYTVTQVSDYGWGINIVGYF